MITTETQINAASNLMQFIQSESVRKTYRSFLKAGDLGSEARPKGTRGRLKWHQKEAVDQQTNEIIERIRHGEQLPSLAREYGIVKTTLESRIRNRGLTVTKIRNSK